MKFEQMREDVQNKHVVIIASGGRTGTTFFGDLLSEVIEDAYSVHEPDLLNGLSTRTWRAIRIFGFYHMVIGRLLGLTGIRNLSQRFLSGRMTEEDLISAIHRHRDAYYASMPQSFIIESYYQWYGILPAVSKAYPNSKIVGIIRDPRTWVTSWMNFGGHYDQSDYVSRFGFKRLNPALVGDAEHLDAWPEMSGFEKNCWNWKIVSQLLSKQASLDPMTRIFRYEDLFTSDARHQHIDDLLSFITSFPDRSFEYAFDESMLDDTRNASISREFPDWQDWTHDQATALNDICGGAMSEFGYGNEPEWKSLVTPV